MVGRRGEEEGEEGGEEEKDDAEPFLSGWDKKGQEETMRLQGRACECACAHLCVFCVYESETQRSQLN